MSVAPIPAVTRAAQQVCASITDPLDRACALADLLDAIIQEARRMNTPAYVRLDALTRALACAAHNETANPDESHRLLVTACGSARVQHAWLSSVARIAPDTPPTIAFQQRNAP
ncbi:MAG TPA: hypothetical protein PLS69_00515 [Terricaulis sp.]|nr:hypothetical protein [Terricaulis sp.]